MLFFQRINLLNQTGVVGLLETDLVLWYDDELQSFADVVYILKDGSHDFKNFDYFVKNISDTNS